jgi:hypothetical protein
MNVLLSNCPHFSLYVRRKLMHERRIVPILVSLVLDHVYDSLDPSLLHDTMLFVAAALSQLLCVDYPLSHHEDVKLILQLLDKMNKAKCGEDFSSTILWHLCRHDQNR